MEPVSELSILRRLTKVPQQAWTIRQKQQRSSQDSASQRRAPPLVEERCGGREGAARVGEGGVDGITLALRQRLLRKVQHRLQRRELHLVWTRCGADQLLRRAPHLAWRNVVKRLHPHFASRSTCVLPIPILPRTITVASMSAACLPCGPVAELWPESPELPELRGPAR